jgi:hypothetical protein
MQLQQINSPNGLELNGRQLQLYADGINLLDESKIT